MAAQAQAAQILDFLHTDLTLLTPRDKAGVLGLLRKTLLATEEHFLATTNRGITIFRDVSDLPRNRIYRVSGMGEVEADAGTVFELLCNLELIPEWDMLFKGARYLNFARDPSGHCEVATIHLVYGLPGASAFVSDRDFVLRTVRVWFPNGMHVLYCTSVGPEAAVEGDPGKTPCTIRGHMWDSGYVVVPTANGCCLNITLQVDPKGWIPTSVVNFSLEAIPLNIDRIRSTLQQLSPDTLAQLTLLNRSQADECKRLPPLHLLGPGGNALHAAAAAAARANAAAAAAARQGTMPTAFGSGCGGASAVEGDGAGVGKYTQGDVWGARQGGAAAAVSEGSEEAEEIREWHDALSGW